MTVVLWILALILVLIGLAGTVIPAVPGTPLVFFGLLIVAWTDNFQNVGWVTLTLLGGLTLLSLGIDIVASGFGAKRVGASRTAVAGAVLGAFIGLFFGIPGLLAGPFLGAVIGQYVSRGDWSEAGKAGFGTWIGFILGVVVKLGLTFTMIGIFVAAFLL